MTSLNDIFDNNFDELITTKPTFHDMRKVPLALIGRGVGTLLANDSDEIMGIMERSMFSPDSHDGYFCWIVAKSEDDARDIKTALKKVCATYTPTAEENILQWEEGEWEFHGLSRHEYKFVVLVRRAGISAY